LSDGSYDSEEYFVIEKAEGVTAEEAFVQKSARRSARRLERRSASTVLPPIKALKSQYSEHDPAIETNVTPVPLEAVPE